MCGIVGFASRRAEQRDELLLRQCLTLCHRGPDDQGSWVSEDRRVGLAHRRLSIIDLTEAGHQPMQSSSGGSWIVFNGEIYNYADVRRELQSHGVTFRTRSDTEVLLAAYEYWGTDCLDRLNGMFAFALFDARRGQLFLARDRAGEKPLFYRLTKDRLVFGSELKALLVDPEVPRVMDAAALEHYLAYGYVPGSMCLLAGIRKLPQAHALIFNVETGDAQVWRYWDLPDGSLDSGAGKSLDELTDELDSLLGAAVQRQLVADVPVGIMLSGGVDSSVITALASRVSSAPVKTFTVAFPGHAAYDEAPYAAQVAAHLGTTHVVLEGDPATVDLLPVLARQFDEPMGDSSMVPTYILSRLIRQHATVALGGDGGDELFGGYPHYSWIARQARMRRWLPDSMRSAVGVVGSRMSVGLRGRNYLVALGANDIESVTAFNTRFDSAGRDRLLPSSARRPWRSAPQDFKASLFAKSASPVRNAMRVDFQTYLVDDILVKVDRASMLASLEVRAPFLDREVLEFAFGRVPDEFRATPTARKVLLRALAKRLLPADLDLQRKQGFSIPLSAWFRGAWGEYMVSVLAEAPDWLFNRKEIEILIDAQRKGRVNEHRLFGLAMLELWRREYDIAAPE